MASLSVHRQAVRRFPQARSVSLSPCRASRGPRGSPARGGWGSRSPPLTSFQPRLPRTRRWAVNDRARDARSHTAVGGGSGRGRKAGCRGFGGPRGYRILRGDGARAQRWRQRGSRNRPSHGGRWDAWARGAARHPDGLVAPKPRRPAAIATTAVAAASTGVPMRALATVTSASSLAAVVMAVALDYRGGGRPAGAAKASYGGAPSGCPRRPWRWLRPPLRKAWGLDGAGHSRRCPSWIVALSPTGWCAPATQLV